MDSSIDRYGPGYWIDGGGAWMTRFHCTSGDLLVMAITIAACAAMACEYVRFASICSEQERRLDSNSPAVLHMRWLKRVFLECVLIHVLGSIVCWFVTPYYIIALLMLHNAWQTNCLNRSKLTEMHYDDLDRGARAEERGVRTRELVEEAIREGQSCEVLHRKLSRLDEE